MIDSINHRDRELRRIKDKLALRMFNKIYKYLDDHEQSEVLIQLKRIIKL